MGLLELIGLLALNGCSSSSDDGGAPIEPEPVLSTPIAFSASQGEEAVTRATSLHDANVSTFKVWGYKNLSSGTQTVFPGYTVNWTTGGSTTNSSGWDYILVDEPEQTIKYWDWSAASYRFFAVTGTNTDYTDYAESGIYGVSYETVYFTMTANASPVRDGEGTAEQKIAANIAATPYFSKLWYSTGQLPTYSDKQFGKPVQLEFIKPFARVRFLFKYSYAQEGIRLKKNEFKPTDGTKIARKGSVTVTYPLTGIQTKESYSVTKNPSPTEGEELDAFTEEYIPEGGPTKEIWYTVLPRTSQGSYTMSVWMNSDNVLQPATRTAVVPAEYMTWLPGYSYTYIFKITEQGGVEIDMVQSAVTPWTELANDHEVYNW